MLQLLLVLNARWDPPLVQPLPLDFCQIRAVIDPKSRLANFDVWGLLGQHSSHWVFPWRKETDSKVILWFKKLSKQHGIKPILHIYMCVLVTLGPLVSVPAIFGGSCHQKVQTSATLSCSETSAGERGECRHCNMLCQPRGIPLPRLAELTGKRGPNPNHKIDGKRQVVFKQARGWEQVYKSTNSTSLQVLTGLNNTYVEAHRSRGIYIYIIHMQHLCNCLIVVKAGKPVPFFVTPSAWCLFRSNWQAMPERSLRSCW